MLAEPDDDRTLAGQRGHFVARLRLGLRSLRSGFVYLNSHPQMRVLMSMTAAVSFLGMLFNIPLDYALINGLWIFPEMGITGAGIQSW